jgi:uncharacterized protein YwgA
MPAYELHKKVADIVRDTGGELVGRTRLQKITYLSQLAGFSSDFTFEYRHYGPYSEELADATRIAAGLKLLEEEKHPTEWGDGIPFSKLETATQIQSAVNLSRSLPSLMQSN